MRLRRGSVEQSGGRIERPKKQGNWQAAFTMSMELESYFQIVRGDPIELGVILAAFIGLRRSEVVGLKWDADRL